MGFIRENIPTEKWEFVNKYAPDEKCTKYSFWDVDYDREAYWISVGFNALEHLNYYLLIWKGKKIFVDTYGWIEKRDGVRKVVVNIILFQADALLEQSKNELVEIVKEALQVEFEGELIIEEMVEPDFSREL